MAASKIQSPDGLTEEQIASGLKARETAILELLYIRYASALFGVIKRIVQDEPAAEEVLQDAFLKVWDKGEDFDPKKGRIFTWMLRISRNLAIDKVRSREYKEAWKTDAMADHSYTIDQKHRIEQRVEDIGVHQLLSHLDGDQQRILELLYFKGYSQSEVAKKEGIPLGTVKTKTRAALKSLRKILKK